MLLPSSICAACVFGLTPFRVEPALSLQPLQRDEERAGIHLEHPARDLLDAPSDPEAVHRLKAECLEDEQVERALNDVGALGGGGLAHGRFRVARSLRMGHHILTVKM